MNQTFKYSLPSRELGHVKNHSIPMANIQTQFDQMQSWKEADAKFAEAARNTNVEFQGQMMVEINVKEGVKCKHAELISYKVHRDQFKSLLVPCKQMAKRSGVSDHHTNSSEHTGANSGTESDISTEGEESDPNSPMLSDKQFLNQSSHLPVSQALVGDYIELKNCKRCGSMIFKDLTASIKPKKEEFNADISPAQILTKMFQDEARYKVDHFISYKDISQAQNGVARSYSQQRSSLIDRFLAMGLKFKQRQKTLHIGIEIMDRFFLDQRSQALPDVVSMAPKMVSIILTTCFLIASKYDEIDD